MQTLTPPETSRKLHPLAEMAVGMLRSLYPAMERPPITVRRDQPTADLLQQHIRVTVSAESSRVGFRGPVTADLDRAYIDLDYSHAGYDPTAGECEPIHVYFFEAGHHVNVKASPVLLSGKTWRIWLEVTEVTCGE